MEDDQLEDIDDKIINEMHRTTQAFKTQNYDSIRLSKSRDQKVVDFGGASFKAQKKSLKPQGSK